jgi:hypothetical protein
VVDQGLEEHEGQEGAVSCEGEWDEGFVRAARAGIMRRLERDSEEGLWEIGFAGAGPGSACLILKADGARAASRGIVHMRDWVDMGRGGEEARQDSVAAAAAAGGG